MKIIVVGGTGLIGTAVVNELKERHDIHAISHKDTEFTVDMLNLESIKEFYQKVGTFDAMVITAGNVPFADFVNFTAEKYLTGLQDKLLGQVNLVLEGIKHIEDKGSFTLTSGIINRDPIKTGTCAAMVNGAVDAFVKSCAIEMSRGIRINCVSPTVVSEAMDYYGQYFRGFSPVPVARVALAYSKSVEGCQTGQVYCVE